MATPAVPTPEQARTHADAMGAPPVKNKVKVPESVGAMTKYKLVFLGDLEAFIAEQFDFESTEACRALFFCDGHRESGSRKNLDHHAVHV